MIKEAAIKLNGIVYTGRRHHEIIRELARRGFDIPILGEQGFVTDTGEFLTRRQAGRLAIESGQVEELKFHKYDLFSEDLY
jgi:hypothetical protein